MRVWSRRSYTYTFTFIMAMASFLLRAAASSRAVGKPFLSMDTRVAAFSVLPDTTLRGSSASASRRTTHDTNNNVPAFRSFSSQNYPSGGGGGDGPVSKRTPKMYTRRPVSGERLYRADRVLANRSGKSRSECFELLKEKRIWQVDPAASASASSDTSASSSDGSDSSGSVKRKVLVMGPSVKMSMHAPLWVDQEPVPLPPQLLQVYHKPVWVLSVRSDPVGRACLNGEEHLPSMHPVGRLE
jgi:hypothetical protein